MEGFFIGAVSKKSQTVIAGLPAQPNGVFGKDRAGMTFHFLIDF